MRNFSQENVTIKMILEEIAILNKSIAATLTNPKTKSYRTTYDHWNNPKSGAA
jgi:hypothetical protein